MGAFELAFIEELLFAGAKLSDDGDLIFYLAPATADLARVPVLAAGLKPKSGLWIVYPKGVAAIREIEVLKAGRDAGLKDIKVASFSSTHTALKFVVPAR